MDPRSTIAIVVGIEKYAVGTSSDLPGPASDAVRFAEWLLSRGVPAENILAFVSSLQPVVFPDRAITVKGATHGLINKALRETLRERQEEMLILFWGGHGVVRADLTHRLFYADATNDDKKNLGLMDLLLTLRSTFYKRPALRHQIVIVDACASFAEQMRWVHSLPSDEFPKGEPVSDREQFVLFATKPGEQALNLNTERAGLFSRELTELLVKEANWPPDFKKIIEQLDIRFSELRDAKKASQTPTYYWFKASNYFVREASIPELLLERLVSTPSKQLTANAKPDDLSSNIAPWAEENGFSPDEIRDQLNQWIAQLERTSPHDRSKLPLAEFYKANFGQAGDLFNIAADEDTARIKKIAQQQAELEAELQSLRVSLIRNRRRAGNALVQAGVLTRHSKLTRRHWRKSHNSILHFVLKSK